MDDRDRYICILEKVSEFSLSAERTETEKRIDRRILNAAAAGAIRAGVPVRGSDDGLFLTIDLDGRSYTVIASAVEAVLREDYDRALSVCRLLAARAYEDLKEGAEAETKACGSRTGRPAAPGNRDLPGDGVFAGKVLSSENGAPRFQRRTAEKETAVPLPEDRGAGSVPDGFPNGKRRFRPAGEIAPQIIENVMVRDRRLPGHAKSYLFLAEPGEDRPAGPFAAFHLTVRERESAGILYEGSCAGELLFSAAGTRFRTVGIRKDNAFHLGIMLAGTSAETCIIETDDE